jgi:hypothetical protein
VSRTKTFSRIAACAFTVLGMLAGAMPSSAYRMIQVTTSGRVTAGPAVSCWNSGGFVHWNNGNISWYHNTAGQGAGKAAALQAAMQSWTSVAGAGHVLTYVGTTTAGFATDGKNTLLWATGNGCSGSCLALTALVVQQPGMVLVEADVTFNAQVTWKTDGTDFDTQAVAAHELGHTLGIHHTELTGTPRPTMFANYFGPDGRTLENDDRAALQCAENRYPSSCPGQCQKLFNECTYQCETTPMPSFPDREYCISECYYYDDSCLAACN